MRKNDTGRRNAKAIIEKYISDTGYADGTITVSEMYDMLRRRMRFGNAEAQCIIAALTIAGAKWRPSSKPIIEDLE